MPEVETERVGHVAVVRLNRPEALNALTVDMELQLAEIWNQVNADPEIRVAILCAAGDRAFCAGADVHDLVARERTRVALGGGLTGIGGPRLRLRKPLIAAVQGHVLGSGLEVALCADIIVASADARFGIPEARLGVMDEAGVIHRVTRALPHRVAMAMILAGETVDAPAALSHGLVNEVVSRSGLDEAAMRWAERVSASAPLVAQAAKQAVEERLGWPLEVALATRYEPIEALATTRDRQEGIDAFRERRDPVWTGS